MQKTRKLIRPQIRNFYGNVVYNISIINTSLPSQQLPETQGLLQQTLLEPPQQINTAERVVANNTIFTFPKKFDRAVQIGINYTGTKNELHGCIEDLDTINDTFAKIGVIIDKKMVLTDNTKNSLPTKDNIINALNWLVANAKENSILFLQYSGHGSQQKGTDKYEADGKDETICPLDMDTAGMISDDEINKIFCKLPATCKLFFLTDCCHSGSNCDLPYQVGRVKQTGGYNQQPQTQPQAAYHPPQQLQPAHYQQTYPYQQSNYPTYYPPQPAFYHSPYLQQYPTYYPPQRETNDRSIGSLILTTFLTVTGKLIERYISKHKSLLDKPLVIPRGGIEQMAVQQVRPENAKAKIISFSGCSDNETSQEFDGHGAMTTAFCALLVELSKQKRAITIENFLQEMYTELTHQGTPQLPQACASFKFSATDKLQF